MVVIIEKYHPRDQSEARAMNATRKMDAHAQQEFSKDIDDWWLQVLAVAQEECPVGTSESTKTKGYIGGTLRDTIRIVYEAPQGSFFEVVRSPETISVDRMITAGGILINPNTGNICDYAQAVHEGHITSGGGFVSGRPFLDIAIDRMMPELDRIMSNFTRELGDIWERD